MYKRIFIIITKPGGCFRTLYRRAHTTGLSTQNDKYVNFAGASVKNYSQNTQINLYFEKFNLIKFKNY